jgi:hypothetical protein
MLCLDRNGGTLSQDKSWNAIGSERLSIVSWALSF